MRTQRSKLMNTERASKKFTSEQSHLEAVENGRKGGIKSGQTRRKNAALNKVVETILNAPIKKYPCLLNMGEAFGLSPAATVKELLVMSCITNIMKSGRAEDLGKLHMLLQNVVESVGDQSGGIFITIQDNHLDFDDSTGHFS